MKVLRLDTRIVSVSDAERKGLSEIGFTRIVELEGNSPEEIANTGWDADVIIVISSSLGADVIERLQSCRGILRRGTGCDKINIAAATRKGIVVANLQGFATADVAEHVMMLMLALARNLPAMQRGMALGTYIASRNSCRFVRLEGKTLGILGFGNIGKAVAVRAKAFGMNIIDHHPHVDPEIEAQYGAVPVPFEQLLAQSDFLVMTCPLNEQTRHLIGERELNLMKPSAYLINVARGAVCDERVLAAALRKGTIAGAGIDVYEHINVFEPAEGQSACLFIIPSMLFIYKFVALNASECYIKG